MGVLQWGEDVSYSCRPNDCENLQFDRCPTLALCPITSFFWHSWDLASQKVKYWAYSSSSFVTYSLLFPGFIRAGSDGVAELASGRLREGRKTSVRIMRRQKLEDREMLCQEFTGLQMYAIRCSQIFSWQARELHRTENNSDCLVCYDRWQQPLSEHNEGDPVSAPTQCHTSEEVVV